MPSLPICRIALFCAQFLIIFSLAGCGTWLHSDFKRASDLAAQGALSYQPVLSPPFVLATWRRTSKDQTVNSISGINLTVYIEGDGAAWINRSQISPDPTPSNPVALKLAVIDAKINSGRQVLYLARPCQFVSFSENPSCNSFYWSSGRYSEAVISSMNMVISLAAKEIGAHNIDLVGYSGGAAAALLIAARRHDVSSIRTVAGNIDPEGLNKIQGVLALSGSLNPRAHIKALSKIPQIYWIGNNDPLITSSFTRAMLKQISSTCIVMAELPGVGHAAGWDTVWPRLLSTPIPSRISCSN